jgi:tryptophan 2,3-dioxygenase
MNKRDFESSIHVDLAGQETYGAYLQLDKVLDAQSPRSNPPNHDELLFIIQHQTSELWMKLLVHELQAIRRFVQADQLKPSFKCFSRVAHIQTVLFDQWAVLETMTPSEYLQFRAALGRSSGFQSFQYRAIEFLLGNKDAAALLPHRATPGIHGWLEGLLGGTSLYDEFIRHLARHGHAVPAELLQRDLTRPWEKSDGLVAVFRRIYEAPEANWDAYEMCEKLVDVEQRFLLWRFRHMKTVHRIIGERPGTGGSSGVGFLRKALDLQFFPELWSVRTELQVPPAGAP